MARRTMVAALAVVLGGWGCWAQAQEQARIIRANGVEQPGAQTYWTEPTGGAPVGVVLRQVASDAVTIDRALAESPVRPFLMEVRIGQTTVYLDPYKDYLRQGTNLIDANQYIPRAQRLWHTLVMSQAQLILPRDYQPDETRSAKLPQPRVIFMKPDAQPKGAPAPGEPRSQPKVSEKLAAVR